ncbi:MAG: UDP-3-O-(3-hydroxymyristoyl)glucosamine N-acyltransferase [Elusimicrobiaceae bacterium]|nr:UDP-3-O-(3-hydroxymyristoyl)glucosamine N-acyltransferase [Elusimicrobiaceae bacterium]
MYIEFKLGELAALCEGELTGGKPSDTVGGPAPLETAEPDSIVYFTDPAKKNLLNGLKAGVLLLPVQAKGLPVPFEGPVIFCADPKLAFSRILKRVYLAGRPDFGTGVDSKASVSDTSRLGLSVYVGAFSIVGPEAAIGEGTVVYPGCYIGHRAKVGQDCLLYPGVVIREDCVIGDRVIIHPNAVIGADGFGYNQTPAGHEKIHQVGRVVIENDVEIGACTTIDRGTMGDTVIGAGSKIDNQVQIAHNVRVGRACIIVSQAGIAGSSSLGDGAIIAGQAGVIDHIKVGSRAIVTAGSGVMNDIPDGAVYFGAPARPHGESMKIQALLGRLPQMHRELRQLKKSAPEPVCAEIADLRSRVAELEKQAKSSAGS